MTFTNWTLIRETMDEQRYMSPLFTFVLKQFMEIFEIEALNSEQCIVYNEPTAPCPMLVTNRAPKYSLQGTTQGNGLTGADMPVRFSM